MVKVALVAEKAPPLLALVVVAAAVVVELLRPALPERPEHKKAEGEPRKVRLCQQAC